MDNEISFGNVLIVGAGPVAINLGVNIPKEFGRKIGIATRKSKNSKEFYENLKSNRFKLTSKVEDNKYNCLAGERTLDSFYFGLKDIDDIWETIIITTPCDAYKSVIKEMNIEGLDKLTTIILISPGIGSNLLVKSLIKKEGIEVLSISSYYAATKIDKSIGDNTVAITKGIKKKVYIGSNILSGKIKVLEAFVNSINVSSEVLNSAMEAESRNINIYVHSPFCFNNIALNEVFNMKKSKKYIYKIYPEGPICQDTIRNMILLWKEISNLLNAFGVKGFNLLKFLNDDNYPVHLETLSRNDIEKFEEFNQTKQEYLMYIRYSSILIDPFSKPDENGRYKEFSNFPFITVYKDEDNKWNIPRIPFEDYKKLKILFHLGEKSKVKMDKTKELIDIFERHMEKFIEDRINEEYIENVYFCDAENEANIIFHERKINNE